MNTGVMYVSRCMYVCQEREWKYERDASLFQDQKNIIKWSIFVLINKVMKYV